MFYSVYRDWKWHNTTWPSHTGKELNEPILPSVRNRIPVSSTKKQLLISPLQMTNKLTSATNNTKPIRCQYDGYIYLESTMEIWKLN